MKKALLALVATLPLWGFGEGIMHWSPQGCQTPHHAARKAPESLSLSNAEGNVSVKLVLPDLSVKTLSLNQQIVQLPKSTVGGYYALAAQTRSDKKVSGAIRYLSRHGRPVKISPTRLTALPKMYLEIVPDPLYREHDRYTASKTYRFVLLYRGKPLSGRLIFLETSNGTSRSIKTDTEGVISLTLPNDFTEVEMGREANNPSEFLLHASYQDDTLLYETSLSMPYHVNPNDYWQSQSWGTATIVFGFLGGILLYRRSKGARNG